MPSFGQGEYDFNDISHAKRGGEKQSAIVNKFHERSLDLK